MSYSADVLCNEDMTEEFRDQWFVPDPDYEPVFCLVIEMDGDVIDVRSDMIEPEDVSFGRDLAWVPSALKQAYQKGVEDGRNE